MNLTEKFLQFTTVGGEWVLWLLVVLSVFSVYVMLDRWLFYRAVSGNDARLRADLLRALESGDVETARSLVKGAKGTGGRIVAKMLGHLGSTESAMQAVMAAIRPAEKIRLERNLSYLGTLGANAPFVGLFGTVLGIIKAFKDLAAAGVQNADNSAVVMAGISEALVATAVGLLVAIPAVVAYNYFQRRVKSMLGEADGLANMVHALAGCSPSAVTD